MHDLLFSLGVFIAFHVIPAVGPVRRALVGTLGTAPYIVGYSMISLGLLGWVGIAYAEADHIELWAQQPWMRWVPVIAMAPVCVLLVGALIQANPLSVGVRADRFDPTKPGIVSVTRHPLIWGLTVWALAHIVPNGDAASAVLFGTFAVLGLAGLPGLDAKAKRKLGADRWAELAGPTSSVPLLAALTGKGKIDWSGVLCIPTLGGAVLYAVLMGAHPFVIGVSPLP